MAPLPRAGPAECPTTHPGADVTNLPAVQIQVTCRPPTATEVGTFRLRSAGPLHWRSSIARQLDRG
jgi:hypothetical protein